MTDAFTGFTRTKYCGEFRDSDAGSAAAVCGWVQRRRDLGGLIFIDLRDRGGVLQLAFDDGTARDVFEKAQSLRSEFVVAARGKIRERSAKNAEIPTGSVELEVAELYVFAESETPPFEVAEDSGVNDALRLKYRWLDLRRPDMQRNLILRHRVAKITRDFFDENGFLEIETPYLTKSTPEGARDYLVPSRVHPGEFYALPQSPQQYKQLLMLAGLDRYFQIARCFRDEDLRADRQPEFTQIDVEMSFVTEEDVIALNERFLERVFREVLGEELALPLPRITYREAMDKYGSDKPDLRFGLEFRDITDIAKTCGFKVFADAAATGAVKLISIPGSADKLTRKQVDSLAEYAKTVGAKGLAWTRVTGDGASSSYSKFLTDAENALILRRAEAVENSVVLIVADASEKACATALGAVRCEAARRLGLVKPSDRALLWVTEFPMFEYSEEEDRYVATHHPFTAPLGGDADKLESDKASCRAKAYDIVMNGVELGGGSIRISDPETQSAAFRALGFTEEAANGQFGHLINAFRFGAPPHGGIAYGLDRLVMLLAGADSIRDVIAFPKVQNASELMLGSPSAVDEKQLSELGIRV
ncbi:MAG: aspartate--tRNA ligase [Oscillospiraceae bacterium]|jgi:aspartyl-tRNA synthetase|nr:aspartate--tRNA ligase [Oscillospiraceae bacterium]